MLGREGGREGALEGGRKAGRAGGWVCPGPRTSLHRRRRCPPARPGEGCGAKSGAQCAGCGLGPRATAPARGTRGLRVGGRMQ